MPISLKNIYGLPIVRNLLYSSPTFLRCINLLMQLIDSPAAPEVAAAKVHQVHKVLVRRRQCQFGALDDWH